AAPRAPALGGDRDRRGSALVDGRRPRAACELQRRRVRRGLLRARARPVAQPGARRALCPRWRRAPPRALGARARQPAPRARAAEPLARRAHLATARVALLRPGAAAGLPLRAGAGRL